ncbi:glycosyl transferase family 2, partial [Acinetobacter baumannii]|nr:glycosyl transferase family 2 [Acinetobacter baumannii]
YFYELIKVINEKKVEIIHFNAKQYDTDKGYVENICFVTHSKISINDESYREKLFLQSYWYPWLRVIKKDILSKFAFDINVYM